METLYYSGRASNQKLNMEKSRVMVSKGIPTQQRDKVMTTLYINDILAQNKCLSCQCM